MREKVSPYPRPSGFSTARRIMVLSSFWIITHCLKSLSAVSVLFGTTIDAKLQQKDESADGDFALAAYLPDYRAMAYLEQQLRTPSSTTTTSAPPLLTDLILFSLQPHSKGFLGGCCLQQEHYDLARKFREQLYPVDHYQPLTVWVTVGGSGRSEAFSNICGDEKLRNRLIKSVINLCQKNSVQGVDLDYTPRFMSDRDNYVVFLQEAIRQWHNAGLKVSMTTIFHPGMQFLSQVYQQIDRLHLMTYDMISRDTDGKDPYHASLAKTKEMLDALLQPGGGMDQTPEKILLGIPAYARHLQSPGNVKTFGKIYDDIVQEHGNDESSVDWNNLHTWKGFEWESGQRIHDKVKLAKSTGLGGIFFWEVGQDKVLESHPRGMLLEAAAASIRYESAADEASSSRRSGEL